MRNFFIAFAFLLALTSQAEAQQSFPNGAMSPAGSEFLWRNGGGDPMTISVEEALALPRIGIPASVQACFLREMRQYPSGRETYIIQQGDRLGDVMVSGPGWLAENPVALVNEWLPSRSRVASVWYCTDEATGTQYRAILPEVCDNLVLDSFGPPIQCVCIPERDACTPD